MNFFLSCIPSFYVKISVMYTTVGESPSIPGWYFSTCVPLKTLTTQHQYQFPLRQMAKKRYGIQTRRKKSSISCCLYDTINAEEEYVVPRKCDMKKTPFHISFKNILKDTV